MKSYPLRLWFATPLVAVWLWAAAASAATVDVTLEAAVAGSPASSVNLTLFQVDNALPGVTTAEGSVALGSAGFVEWTVSADPDPFIQAVFTVTNNTADTRTFGMTVGLPTTLAGPVLKSGSLAADFADAGGDGAATLNILDWRGLIDGTTAMTLLSGSFACSGGPGCTGSMFPVTDGPLPDAVGVTAAIGLNVVFSLTAGDTATFDTKFEVVPVPVPLPAAVWLLGSGLIGLAGMRRCPGHRARH